MVIPNNEMHGDAGGSERACDVPNTSAASSAHWLVNIIPGQITSVYQGLLNRGAFESVLGNGRIFGFDGRWVPV